ncbi:MAG: hypothetical protein ACUZ8H_05285 [Candidatus Anammoxibacter sp.]
MPKYEVKIKVTRILKNPIAVFASDEAEAEEKAVDIVLAWDDVEDADAVGVGEV